MPTLFFATVGGSRWEPRVAFPADHLVAVVFAGEGFEAGLDDATAEAEDEVKG